MALSTEATQNIVKKHQAKETDTSSAPVQIALLTARLEYLNGHFKANPKDHHSRQGLMKIVGKRKRLLSYYQNQSFDGYKKLIQELGIRK